MDDVIIDEPIGTSPQLQLVKVKFFSQSTGELAGREYTYFSFEFLKIGDVVNAPAKEGVFKAVVTAIDVPESEIAAYRDKVKIIPAGSVLPESEKYGEIADRQGVEVIDNIPSIEQERVIITDQMASQPELKMDDGIQEETVIMEPVEAEPYEMTTAMVRVGQSADELSMEVFQVKEITTTELHEQAEKWISKIRIELQNNEKARKEDIKKPSDYVSWVNGKYREKNELLKRAEGHLLKIIGVFRQKKEEERRKEQARQDEIARKAFEKKQAEEEAARKREAEARAAEEEAKRKGDEEAAEKARQEAQKAAAEAEKKANVIPVPVAPVVETVEKTSDTGEAKNIWGTEWDFEIVHADQVPREYCIPDEKRIRQFAKLMKDKAAMAGVRFFEKPKVQVRRSK